MPEQKEQCSCVSCEQAFLPNPYAKCECELSEEWESNPSLFPICTHFDAVHADDLEFDCCDACRHSARCHLKGHQPAAQGEGEHG